MVLYKHVEGGGGDVGVELPPTADYMQSPFALLDNIPETQLTAPSHPVALPHLPMAGQLYSDSANTSQMQATQGQICDSLPSEVSFSHSSFISPDQLATSSCGSYQPADELSYVSSQQLSQPELSSFAAYGPVDNVPITRLDYDCITQDSSSRLMNDLSSDGSKTFTVVPVMDNDGYVQPVDNSWHRNDCYTPDNTLQKDSRTQSVHSDSSLSDVYMNSDYTDTVTSADSSTFLIPSSKCYSDSGSSTEDLAHVPEESSSLTDGACTEPSYSDLYMNNSYTDTVSSSDSSTFLLHANKSNRDSCSSSSRENLSHVPCIPEESSLLTPSNTCYNNDAFSDSKKQLSSRSCDEAVQTIIVGDGCAAGIQWVVTVPEEDSGTLADKEDSEDDSEDKELVSHQPSNDLEHMVHQLAEQSPGEVVNIEVEVLDGPVYKSLTEPLTEEGWLQSTESLHVYKLMKQGRLWPASTSHKLRACTMNNLHERSSFLNLTAASVTNLGRACQKALTYVRSDMEFGSMMSLRDSVSHLSTLTPGKGQPPSKEMEALNSKLGKKGEPSVPSGNHTRNVIYMALLITILLISMNSTRNLQSSLNQEGGVGVICLSVLYASYMLGSLVSPALVQGCGVKACITGGLVFILLYVAGNLYPVMWVMVPASMGGGASLAIIWNAMSTYIVLLARGESAAKAMSYERVSDKYFAIFCLIYQSNLIFGNLISSLVLTFGDSAVDNAAVLPIINSSGLNSSGVNLTVPYDKPSDLLVGLGSDIYANASTSNSSPVVFDASVDTHYHLCGSSYCHSYSSVVNQGSSVVSDRTIYLLFGIFMFLIVVTLLMAAFLLEPLSAHLRSSSRPWHIVRRQLVSMIKFSRNLKFLLLLPLMLFSVMQFSFVASEVMVAYVTCPVGVWLVGYTLLAYGICCSVSSYLTQALVPHTGRGFFITLATALNVGLLVFMRIWQPHPDSVLPLFVITSLFGLADGIWNVNANGLCGSVFPDHYEEAFTGLRVAQGLGGAFSMAYSSFFCMAVKIYIMIVVAVIVLLGYIGAEVIIRRDAKKHPVLYEKEIV